MRRNSNILTNRAIAQTANEMKKEKYSIEFYTRPLYYKNLIDTTTFFMRPGLKNVNWLTTFDLLATKGSEAARVPADLDMQKKMPEIIPGSFCIICPD